MVAPVITALPAYPVRGETQANFATKANATVAAMPTMVTETNALGTWMNSTAVTVAANAVDVQTNTTAVYTIAGTYTEINQGAHATPPTLRNSGAALVVGDLYYDTALGKMQIWS